MIKVDDVIEALRSHGTLERQAREKFKIIADEIVSYLYGLDHRNTDYLCDKSVDGKYQKTACGDVA